MNEEIKYETNIPVPPKNEGYFADALRKCPVGASFIYHKISQSNLHSCANQIGVSIATRKQPDGSYRIWRKS